MQQHTELLSEEEKTHFQAALLDTQEQAILAVDLSGRILYWNRFAEDLFGWSLAEVRGRSIGEVLAVPLWIESARSNLVQLRNGKGWSGEFQVQRQDGATLLAQLSASLVLVEQRTLIGIVCVPLNKPDLHALEEANRLLAQASVLLVDAVDTQAPLNALARLTVPHLADWCAIHLVQPGGTIDHTVLAPAEMAKRQAANDWLQNYLPNDDINGLPAVLRSGVPKLVTDVASNFWSEAAAIKSYMIVPLITPPQPFGAITFVAAESGRTFDLNTLALAENLVNHIAIYLDKARLYQESQRLNAELEQRVIERTVELLAAVAQLKHSEGTVQTLFRISKKLNATLDVTTILDDLAQEAIRIVNGEGGFAGLRVGDSMIVRKYFWQGMSTPFEYAWPLGQGIPGWVLKYKVPYGTSDAAHDPMFQRELAINSDVRSIICTPILDSVGEVLGYFDIRNKQDGDGFTISDQEMLMALAPVASIAIQNALAYQQRLAAEVELKESYERLRALAANIESVREEERTRIARELHDQLGQALTALKFDLAWLAERLEGKDAALAQKAKAITGHMDIMIKTVRRIATELRPAMLDDLGLAAAIEWQARDFEKRTGIVCAVNVPGDEDLPLARDHSVALFRIFQEALTNIARHAHAQNVEVNLNATPRTWTLEVHDDGRGIQTEEIAGRHSLGLLGMRERATRLGGTFDIQGIPGEGTTVTVSFPATSPEEMDE